MPNPMSSKSVAVLNKALPDRCTYVYGVVAIEQSETVESVAVRGIGDTPVSVIPLSQEVGVLVSEVKRRDVTGPGEDVDVDRLRSAIETHERVLEWAMANGGCLPMRFGMACRDEGDVKSSFANSISEISSELRQLRGTSEFGVKIYVDPSLLF